MKHHVFGLLMGLALIAAHPISATEVHLTLDEAVADAIEANPGLRALDSSATAADREANATAHGRWGSLDAVASYDTFQDDQIIRPISRQLLNAGIAGLPFDDAQWHYGVVAQLPLYVGGKLTNGIAIARISAEQAHALLDGSRWQIRYNVRSLYHTAQSLDAVLVALDGQIEALDATTSRLQLMVDEGKRPEIDHLKVVEELEAARSNRAVVKAKRSKVGAVLLSMLGQDPAQGVTVDPLPTRLPQLTVDPAELRIGLDEVAPIRHARLDVDHAGRAVAIANSDFMPKLMLRGNYMVNDAASLHDSENTWALSLGVDVPVFRGGARFEHRAAAKERRQAAEHALVTKQLDVATQLESALADLEAAQAAVSAASARVAAGVEAARIEQIRYDTGAGTIEDLLRARAREEGGHADLAQARASLLVAAARVNSIVEKEVVK